MKQLRITALYGSKGRKMVTFDNVPEEVSDYFINLFLAQNGTGEKQATVEGNNTMNIRISILHAEQRF